MSLGSQDSECRPGEENRRPGLAHQQLKSPPIVRDRRQNSSTGANGHLPNMENGTSPELLLLIWKHGGSSGMQRVPGREGPHHHEDTTSPSELLSASASLDINPGLENTKPHSSGDVTTEVKMQTREPRSLQGRRGRESEKTVVLAGSSWTSQHPRK